VIKASSSRQISALVADLSSDRAVAREAAVARLTVIGARAVDPLIALVESAAAPFARAAALRTLEAISDPHARAAIVRAIDDPDTSVAEAACTAARGYLRGPHGADVLDRLTRAALDRSRGVAIRSAAVNAMRALPASAIAPILRQLHDDPEEEVRAVADSAPAGGGRKRTDPARTLAAAVAGRLPGDPALLRHAIVSAGGSTQLTDLLRVIEAVRQCEERDEPERRAAWRAARAAAHLSLANRGSRIALFDLRESLEAAGGHAADARQPVEFLAALSAVGDASCLEAIAAAHARARDRWWSDHLAKTFRTIVAREGLTRRHGAIRKIEKRWPAILRT
jgi:hypothetical protein